MNKKQLKICYSLVREQNLLIAMKAESVDPHHESYLQMKIDTLELLLKAFPLVARINCRSMHADYRNGDTYERYKYGNWVAHQTNKKYGRNANSWMAAKRIREKLGLQEIPF